MKTSFRKVFYWSLGSHAGLLVALSIVALVASCNRRNKVMPHVFTLHAAPPAEKPVVKVSEPKPQPPVTQPKKTPPPVVKKPTPTPKEEPKQEKPKPKPTPSKSYEDFLKENPLPKKEQPTQPVTTPQKPLEDPLKDIRSELQSMIKDTQTDTSMTSSQLKALQSYVGQLRNQINVLWEQPQALPPGEWVAHVEFTVSGSGKISGIRFVKRSGNPVFDDSIVHAMNQFRAAPPTPDRKTHTFELPFRIVLK